jgi:hypothetical protein
MNDNFFSYKFLVATIDALEFRAEAYLRELHELNPDDVNRISDIENDVALLNALLCDLRKKLLKLIETSRTAGK